MDRQARLICRRGGLPARLAAVLLPLVLAACAGLSREVASLQVEQRPAEGLIRITNSGPRDFILYYTDPKTFTSPYNMLRVRFRDSTGRVLDGDNAVRGWWTAMMSSSTLFYPRVEPPPRRPLTIPARGHVDVRRNMDWLTANRGQVESAVGLCEVQVMLSGYPGMRWSDRPIEVLSGWEPAPCPAVNARRFEPSPRR